MIIIMEGCDCTGKTTFAEMLAEKTGFEVVKGSSFEIAELGQFGMYEHMWNLLDRDNIIIDRFLYSNLVYGSIYNYPMMQPIQYMSLVEKLNRRALVVYLQASPIVISERMAIRGDDMIKADDIHTILASYNNNINGLFMPKTMLSLDTTNSNFNVATAMVTEFIDSAKTYIKAT
jgi:thymidylate kinase